MGSSDSETETSSNAHVTPAPAVSLTTAEPAPANNNILDPPPANMVRSVSANQPSPILVPSSNSHPSPPQHSFYPSRRSVSTSAGDLLTGLKIMTTVQNDNSNPTSPIPSSAATAADPHVISSIDDFHIKTPIGYGSSAIVYSAIHIPTNSRMALKMIDLDMFERNQIDELRRETALMALSKHTNVLRVFGSFVHGSKLYIATPYLSGGSCLDIMKTSFPDGIDELSIATILKQALEGLAYLHRNGHIHRDVKAGNLLMDEDGTVLLADFGVSSSLMDTGERGMRKTFVGTPCWMAPEVMEQAGYDYKADIWSFGITSIELATGHAPFAKLPPLKVLMMTLSSDPPTLARETAAHKYSRAFKDMIDLCLNKDASKRPSADKLLQHPFFKQAKRKDYLVKSLLADLPPLEQRPRKKIPQRQISITKTDEWDFEGDDDEETTSRGAAAQQRNLSDQQPKRHISFGDVVVRNPPQPYSGSPSSTASSTNDVAKKSRFIVEEMSREQSEPFTESHPNSYAASEDDQNGVKKGRFEVNQLAKQGSDHSVESVRSDLDRKSRFEVQHNSPQLGSASSTATSIPAPIPLSRTNSISSTGTALTREGSSHSRVARHHADSNPDHPTEPRKIGRFELTSASDHARAEATTTSTNTSKPEGLHAFESPYSSPSNGSSTTSPSSSLSRGQLLRVADTASVMSTFQSQMEELIKANDAQHHILQEMLGLFNHFKPSAQQQQLQQQQQQQQQQLTDDTSQKQLFSSLEAQVQQSSRDILELRRENEALRRELQLLREAKQTTIPKGL